MIISVSFPDTRPESFRWFLYHEKMILEYCTAAGYEWMHIVPSHILAVRNLRIREGRTLSNLDPFDRLLIAQAKTEECVLLSHDRNLENYLEKCVFTA